MRRAIIGIALVGALGLGGCFLLQDDYPDDSCEMDTDCFRAQGEVCDLMTNTCVVPADAGPLPDAPPTFDAAPTPDAGPMPDAGPPVADASPTPDTM